MRSLVFPVLLYVAETWTLKADETKDAKNTLDCGTNQHVNHQRNTVASQAECFT